MAPATAPRLLLVSSLSEGPRDSTTHRSGGSSRGERPASFWRFEGSPPPGAGKTPVLGIAGLGLDGRAFARLGPLAAERDLVLANLPNDLPPGARMEELARISWKTLDAAGHGGRPALLMGSSFGSMIALAAALEAPDRAAGLVLLGGGAAWSDVSARLRAASHFVRLFPRRPFPSIFAAFMVPPSRHPDPATRDDLRAQFLHRTRDYAERSLGAMRGFDARPRLGSLAMPALVVHGGDDRVLPPRAGAALAAALPRATLHAMAGCGHLPHVSRPGEVVEAVGKFLAKEGL